MSTLEKTVSGAVVCLTLNRPDKRNAVDDGMRLALTETLAALDGDASVRVVILTGAGTAFCAGVDLATPGNVGQDLQASASPRPRLSDPLDRFSKPVLAALNGVAAGGGLELALACDMRIAANTARFSLPEVRLGSIAGSGGTQRLSAAVGSAMAAQMLFTGEMISAERAFQSGLVSELVAPDVLMDRAWAIAQSIAENAPLSLQAVKRALRAAIETPLAAGLDLERSLYFTLAETEDRKEGRAAFRERRKPNFRGR